MIDGLKNLWLWGCVIAGLAAIVASGGGGGNTGGGDSTTAITSANAETVAAEIDGAVAMVSRNVNYSAGKTIKTLPPGYSDPTVSTSAGGGVIVTVHHAEPQKSGSEGDASSVSVTSIHTSNSVIGLTAADPAGGFGPFDLVAWQIGEFQQQEEELEGRAPVAGVFHTQTQNCDVYGTVDMLIDDADNNNKRSAGDTVTVIYNECERAVAGGISYMDGKAKTKYNQVVGDPVNGQRNMTVTLTNMIIDFSDKSYVKFNGDMSLDLVLDGNYLEFDATGRSFSYTDANNFTRRLTDYWLEVSSPDRMANVTYTFSGTLANPQTLGGAVAFETTMPFSGPSGDHPRTGRLVVSGAKPAGAEHNSCLRLEVLDSENVQLEIDADGDGNFEKARTVDWGKIEL